MLTKQDYEIGIFTLDHMFMMLQNKLFTQAQFDLEVKNYIGFLLDKGLEVEQMDNMFKTLGWDIKINVHTIE